MNLLLPGKDRHIRDDYSECVLALLRPNLLSIYVDSRRWCSTSAQRDDIAVVDPIAGLSHMPIAARRPCPRHITSHTAPTAPSTDNTTRLRGGRRGEILAERFARGEIDENEYRQRLSALREHP